MPDYRRYRVPGGRYFFTVNLLERFPNDLLVTHIDILRNVVRDVPKKRPFVIDAWVALSDHLHCVWTLPPSNDDFSNRSLLIKLGFSKPSKVGNTFLTTRNKSVMQTVDKKTCPPYQG